MPAGITGHGQIDSVSGVRLVPGETTTLTLTWDGASDYLGTHTLEASSDDSSDTAPLEVVDNTGGGGGDGNAYFDVSIDSLETPIGFNSGVEPEITVSVENTGDEAASQTITLENSGGPAPRRTIGQASLSLDSGGSQTFTWTFEDADQYLDTHTVEASSDDDSARGEIRVEDDTPFFDVEIETTNGPLDAGSREPGRVTATITNTGSGSARQDIRLVHDERGRLTSEPLSLGSGESALISLQWLNATDNQGTHNLTVQSEDDSADTELSVNGSSAGSGKVLVKLLFSAPWENQEVSVGESYSFNSSVDRDYPDSWYLEDGIVDTDEDDFATYHLSMTGRVGGEYGYYRIFGHNNIRVLKTAEEHSPSNRIKGANVDYIMPNSGKTNSIEASEFFYFDIEPEDDGGGGGCPPGNPGCGGDPCPGDICIMGDDKNPAEQDPADGVDQVEPSPVAVRSW